jgi:hypothetical protein
MGGQSATWRHRLATSDPAPIPDSGRGRQHVRKVLIPEVAGPHSITSLARASITGEMVIPMAFAALSLMTNAGGDLQGREPPAALRNAVVGGRRAPLRPRLIGDFDRGPPGPTVRAHGRTVAHGASGRAVGRRRPPLAARAGWASARPAGRAVSWPSTMNPSSTGGGTMSGRSATLCRSE